MLTPAARRAAVALSLVPTSGRSLDVRLSIVSSAQPPPSRPTHFLSLRLPDPSLHANVARVQAVIVANERRARGCEVPPAKSHLTAFVLSLASDESVERAKAALAECAALVAPGSSPPRIRISGLASFRQQVVFAQVQPSDDLDRVAALVRDAHRLFDRAGLSPPSLGSWTPHLTLLKISRSKPRKGKPPPKLPAAAYEDLPASSLDFGEHELGALELCAMQGGGVDGFYPVLASVSLDGTAA